MPRWRSSAVIRCATAPQSRAVVALSIAYALKLENPQWAMLTVFVVVQPVAGMVFAKGLYRLLGTLAGAAGAIAINLPAPFDNEEEYTFLKALALNGQNKSAFEKNVPGAWRYDIIDQGLKVNMPDLNAAVGLAGRAQSLDAAELSRSFGRIAFAGEHTSRQWPGYMNGAVESGQRAARDLEIGQVRAGLKGRPVAELIHLPVMSDPQMRMAAKLLIRRCSSSAAW